MNNNSDKWNAIYTIFFQFSAYEPITCHYFFHILLHFQHVLSKIYNIIMASLKIIWDNRTPIHKRTKKKKSLNKKLCFTNGNDKYTEINM